MEDMQVVSERNCGNSVTNDEKLSSHQSYIKDLIANIDSDDVEVAYDAATLIKNKIIGSDRKKSVAIYLNIYPHLVNAINIKGKTSVKVPQDGVIKVKIEVLHILTSLSKAQVSTTDLYAIFSRDTQRIILLNIMDAQLANATLICLNSLSTQGLLIYDIFFEESFNISFSQLFENLNTLKNFENLSNILAKMPIKVIKHQKNKLITTKLLDILSSKLSEGVLSDQIKENILQFYQKLTSITSLPTTLWSYILQEDHQIRPQKLLKLFDELQYANQPFQVQFLAAKCVLNIYKALILSFGKSHPLHICQFNRLLTHPDPSSPSALPSIDALILTRTLPTFVRLVNFYKEVLDDGSHRRSSYYSAIDNTQLGKLGPQHFDMIVESLEALASLVELHPQLQSIACYTGQLLVSVNDLLSSKTCILIGIEPDSNRGKILKGSLLKLCSALTSNHEALRKRMIEQPYNLMDCVSKMLTTTEIKRDRDAENLKFCAIRVLISLSRSIQLLRTSFLDSSLWKWVADSLRLYHKEIKISALPDAHAERELDIWTWSHLRIMNACICLLANLLLEVSPAKEYLVTQTDILQALCQIIRDKKYDEISNSDFPVKQNAFWALMNATFKSEKSFKSDLLINLSFNSTLRPVLKQLVVTEPFGNNMNHIRDKQGSIGTSNKIMLQENKYDEEIVVKILGLLRNICAGGKSHLNAILPIMGGENLIETLSAIINAPLNRGLSITELNTSIPTNTNITTNNISNFSNVTAYHKELAICVLINLCLAGDILNDDAGDLTTSTTSMNLSTGSGKNDRKLPSSTNLPASAKNYPIYDDDITETDYTDLSKRSSGRHHVGGTGHNQQQPSAPIIPGGGGGGNIERLLMSGGIIPATPLEGLAYSILHPSLANLAQHLPHVSTMRFMTDVITNLPPLNYSVLPSDQRRLPPNYGSSDTAATNSFQAPSNMIIGSNRSTPYHHPTGTGIAGANLYSNSTCHTGGSTTGLPPPPPMVDYGLPPLPSCASSYLSPTNILRNFLSTKLRYNLALREDILRGLIGCVFESLLVAPAQNGSEPEEEDMVNSKGRRSSVSQISEDIKCTDDQDSVIDLRKNSTSANLNIPPIHIGQPVIEAPVSVSGFSGPSHLSSAAIGTGSGLNSQENSNMDMLSIGGVEEIICEMQEGEPEPGEIVEEEGDMEEDLGGTHSAKNSRSVSSESSDKNVAQTLPPERIYTSISNIGQGTDNSDSFRDHTARTSCASDLALTSGVSYTVSILAQLNSKKNNPDLSSKEMNADEENNNAKDVEDITAGNGNLKTYHLNSLQRSAIRCLNAIYSTRNLAKIDNVTDYIPFPLNTLTREYGISSGANPEEASSNGRVSIRFFYWRILYNVLKATPKPVLMNFYYNNSTNSNNSAAESNKSHAKDKFLALKSFIKMLKRQTNIIATANGGADDGQDENYASTRGDDDPHHLFATPQTSNSRSSKLTGPERAPQLSDIVVVKTKNNSRTNVGTGTASSQTSNVGTSGGNVAKYNEVLIDTNRESVKNIVPAFVNWLKEESKNNKRRAANKNAPSLNTSQKGGPSGSTS